ncbi:MAG: 50S ribosomal protein L15 [Candidatus Omnitrophica bacterium]|nr:50S ribosomal protein L15 [Candidatus Omnitrophota bacterium]
MQLHQLKAPKGVRKSKRIVGRGRGSGRGKTAGRGENGQRSRSGRWSAKASEGGQMRLIRRLPKVGFRSHRPILNQVVNLEALNKFEKGEVVSVQTLKEKGLISSANKPVKILAKGDIKKALTVQIASISKSAQEKITKAGGKIEEVKASEEKTSKETKK